MFKRIASLLLVAVAATVAAGNFGCCCGGGMVGAGGYTPQPSPYIVNATDADFDAVVLAANKPVVVDFWAPWCGPCAMLDPTVVKLAEEFKDRVTFVRVNVDDSPAVASKYDASRIPMLGLYHGGELIDKRVGVQPEGSLRAWLLDQLRPADGL